MKCGVSDCSRILRKLHETLDNNLYIQDRFYSCLLGAGDIDFELVGVEFGSWLEFELVWSKIRAQGFVTHNEKPFTGLKISPQTINALSP